MSLSKFKFLLDENVRIELFEYLQGLKIDAITAPKRTSNGKLADFSKKESRILVTNDMDFSEMTANKLFAVIWLRLPQAVIWLRLPQKDLPAILSSFKNFLDNQTDNLEGKLVIIGADGFEIVSLAEEVSIS